MPSSTRPTRDSQVRLRAAPEEVTVDDWGLRDRPLASLVAMTLAAGASWLAALGSGSLPAGIAVAIVLAVILWRTWLPVRYQLGSGGVTQSVLGWRRRIPWLAIQRFDVRESGVLLLADPAPTPLAPLRGLFLPWGNQREEVLAIVEFYVPNGSARQGRTTNHTK
jgi:hypothetical protein